MSLSFREKSDLNRRILDLMALRLVDKTERTLPEEGQSYVHDHPADQSLMGSIGQAPNPDYTGFQAPNSMGLVLLVKPDKTGNIRINLSGQCDVFHRTIPTLQAMREKLNLDGDTPKPSQTILTSHRRYTLQFNNIPMAMSLPKDINQWIRPAEKNALYESISSLEALCVKNPLIFKRCKLGKTGSAIFFFDWDDDAIQTQEDLNAAVTRDIFDDTSEVMPYRIELRMRVRPAPPSLTDKAGAYLLEIYLENSTSLEETRQFGVTRNAHLLDAQFSVQLNQGDGLGLPHKLEPADYRYKKTGTVPGYGITTSVEQVGPNHYATQAMPISSLAKTRNPSPEELSMHAEPTFSLLATDPIALLQSLIIAVRDYGEQWQVHIDQRIAAGDTEEAVVSQREREALLAEASLMEEGVTLLEDHPQLLESFRWMNEAMGAAFSHQGKSYIVAWRLFQLGFILTQIRAVYERSCKQEELTDHLNTAEVLWFATGGGKTEAYLGIVLMSMLYERLHQRRYGVTAWMKFPLRMLSVQQFQRLAYVIAQANRIRAREQDRLPGHPFTVGYFTGEGTPKMISSHFDNHLQTFLPTLRPDQLNRWKFIHDCPYCENTDSVAVIRDLDKCRIKHVCTNDQCWSNTQAPADEYGGGIRGELGIYVSDEEVYRYQPTVLVGTIDKLAVIAHNKKFRVFFGGATHYCPDHGFSFEGKCTSRMLVRQDDGSYLSELCPNNSRTSTVRTQALGPMVMPGIQFILQDELHLLSENTGNFDSHYETLMSSLQEANGGRAPKVLSATATIKGYSHHINHLYQRHARRFPVPGIAQGESFYSRIDEDNGTALIRRWYAGILPLGSGSVMERATAIASTRYLTLIDELREGLITAPDETTQLLGLATEHAPALLAHIETYLNACLLYNNSIRGNSDLHRHLEENQLEYFPDRRWVKLDGETSLDDIQAAIQLIETKLPDDPTRQILATSVVSHGVDMARLNFMVVGGWPKSMAEYMQSSARAGRVEPGIVLSVMNSKNLFQSNVYLDFQDYHRFMDRMVESVPVNRFAPNLLERTLPGVFSACINNWAPSQPWGTDIMKNAGKVRDALNDNNLGVRELLKAQLLSSLAVPPDMEAVFDQRVTEDFMQQLERKVEWALNAFEGMSSSMTAEMLFDVIERLLGNRPMRGLRDIESQIIVKPQTDTQNLIDALARNT